MRRLIAVSAFALVLAVPLWAQRGGGHGGGGHASFGGGHAGGFAGHSSGFGRGGFSGGAHTGAGFARQGFSHTPFLHDGFRDGFHTSIRTYGFRNPGYGYGRRWGYRYPWYGWGYWDPWWWDNGSYYDDDYNQNLAIANEMNEQNLAEQRMMRQEEADGDQDAYARRDPPQREAVNEKPGAPIMPATVLVFRDQHKEEIQNYAIVGQTLWNFAPQRTEKISLAQLDLPATTKANDDRGITFRLPDAR